MATMDMERLLELGIKTEFAKRTYISANSIPCYGYRDNTSEKKKKYCVIYVKPGMRISPNYNKWELSVDIIAVTHIADDKDSAILEQLYNEGLSFLNTITKATLSTASTLTIDGILPSDEPGEENILEDYQIKIARAKIYLTKTAT